MASMKTTASPAEPHFQRSPFSEARPPLTPGKHFVESFDATVARRITTLVDMLAWIRIELAAEHPDGLAPVSNEDRMQRALVQVEMALAMTKQLSTELTRNHRVGLEPGY